jgi:hypothetical protein
MKNDQLHTDSTPDQKVKKSIFDFFKLNLTKVPDNRFVKGVTESDSSGDSIQHYHACLEYLECDIFNSVKIVKFHNNLKNIFFKCHSLSKLNVYKVKNLINSLYLVYGIDDSSKGKFTDNDLKDYNSDEFYMVFGRRWIDDKFKYPVAIEINRETNVIILSILGLESE